MNKFNLLLAIVILSSFSLVCATITITETGSGNKDFDVSDNASISNPSLVVSGDDDSVHASLNGNDLGTIDSISITSGDFDVGQTNHLTFSGDITSFTLTYNYYRTDKLCPTRNAAECPPDNTYTCNQNKWGTWRCFLSYQECDNNKDDCNSNEDCLNDKCCLKQYPLSITTPISESCLSSAFPVVPKSSCSSVNNANINFYLKKGTDDRLVRSGCTLDGDLTWALEVSGDIIKRCGINTPADLPLGVWELRAEYTIDSHPYSQIIKDITISTGTTCGINSACQHSAGIQEGIGVTPGSLTATEISPIENGIYYIPRNSVVSITGISPYNVQCSNGVVWSGIDRPGVVTWTENLGTSDPVITGDNGLFNQGACKIPNGYNRDSLIGLNAKEEAYLPPGCDMAMSTTMMGNRDIASVYNFPNQGYYSVIVDYINAHCDAPDYICPYIQPEGTTSLCWIGSMDTREKATGWKHLSDHLITVVNPDINVEYISKTPGSNTLPARFKYNITNTGVGKVNVTPQLIDSEFEISEYYPSSSFPLNETQEREMTVGLLPKETREITTNSIYPFNYTLINLTNYASYSYDVNTLTINYSIPFNIVYDDNYGFASQPSQIKTQTLDFSYGFKCNGSEMQVIELKDKIFYCTCEGKGFCVNDKSQDDKPCACISNPKKGSVIVGEDVLFNGSRSFDDIANPSILMFNWAYAGSNQSIYKNNGTAGAIFSKHFAVPGQYFVNLDVNDSNKIGSDYTNFVLVFNQPFCLKTQLIWVETSGSLIPSRLDCYREFGNNTQYCCPVGSLCVDPGDGDPWYCNLTAEMNVSRCSDYANSTDCLADKYSVGQMSVNEKLTGSLLCDKEHIINNSCIEYISNCGCDWKSDKCIANWDYDLYCDGINKKSGTCDFITSWVTDNCQLQGVMDVVWEALWSGTGPKPVDCEGGHRFVPCERIMGLNFINIYSLLIGMIVIIFIYYYKIWKNKEYQ